MPRPELPLREYWNLLSKHIRPHALRFVALIALMLSSIGLQVVNPQIVRTFIDAAAGKAETKHLLYAALAFAGLALMQQMVTLGTTYFGEDLAWNATNALRSELVRHCLQLDKGPSPGICRHVCLPEARYSAPRQRCDAPTRSLFSRMDASQRRGD